MVCFAVSLTDAGKKLLKNLVLWLIILSAQAEIIKRLLDINRLIDLFRIFQLLKIIWMFLMKKKRILLCLSACSCCHGNLIITFIYFFTCISGDGSEQWTQSMLKSSGTKVSLTSVCNCSMVREKQMLCSPTEWQHFMSLKPVSAAPGILALDCDLCLSWGDLYWFFPFESGFFFMTCRVFFLATILQAC